MFDSSLNDLGKNRKSYTNTDTPLQRIFKGDMVFLVYASLSRMVENNANEAALLSQINFWVYSKPVSVVEKDGQRWLKMSAQEMWDRGFKLMTPQGINKAIRRLVQIGFLVLHGRAHMGQRKEIRVNYALLQEKRDEMFGKKPVEFKIQLPEQLETVKQIVETEHSTTGNPVSGLSEADHIYIKDHKDSKDLRGGFEGESGNNDNNSSPKNEMEAALIAVCHLDAQIESVAQKVSRTAKNLVLAGYTAQEILGAFMTWWRTKDWRGRKGDIPTLHEVELTIRQALAGSRQVGKSQQSLLSGPGKMEAQNLKRQANPACPHCEGQGWRLTYDPRLPWEICGCIHVEIPNSQGKVLVAV